MPPAEQHARLQDVERRKADALELLFHLALGAQVEVARTRVGARARHDHEALRLGGERRAREGHDVVDVDLTEILARTRAADRRAEAAHRDIARHALQLRLHAVELHDAVGETRVLACEGTARHGDHAPEVGRGEHGVEQIAAGKAARAGEQRDPGLAV